MSAITCPFCGSNNDSSAAACRVCGVDFTQLPDELKPKDTAAESKSAGMELPPEEDQSGIPAWLRKRMNNQSDHKEAASFDSYLDAILGKPQAEDAISSEGTGEITQPGLFGEEDLNALMVSNEESSSAQLTEEEQLYTDFSMFRPEKKWEDVASNEPKEVPSPANENAYIDFSHFRPEKKWDDGPSAGLKNPSASENEEDYSDFSMFRPEKKWDDRMPVGGETSTSESSLTDNEPYNTLEEQDYTRSINSKSSDDQLALFDTLRADNDSSPTDFETMGLELAELPYVDFSVNRPARKWDDGPEEVSGKEIREASEQLLSVVNESSQFDDAEDEVPIAADGLVGNFLSQMGTSTPADSADEDPVSVQSEDAAGGSLPEVRVEDELDFLFDAGDQSTQTVDVDLLLSTDAAASGSQAPAAAVTEPALEFDFDFRDNVTPGNAGVDQSLDEVPWNLFEADPMQLSGIPGEPVYATFSRSGLEQPAKSSDYQERMISAILEKIFKIEGINHPFVRAETRKTSKFGLLLLSLLLIAGVVLLLLTNIGDSIPLTNPAVEKYPNLMEFNRALEGVDSGSRALIVIDYTPAYAAELTAPLDSLLTKLSQKAVSLDLVTANPLSISLMQSIVSAHSNMELQDLGYRAGGVIGMSDLLTADPALYENIYLIAAGFTTTMRWAEQSVLWADPIPMHVISSARLESLIEPYRQAAVFTSQLSSSMEKQLFAGNLAVDPESRRKLLAVWFLLGMAIVMIIVGYFAKNPFRSIVAVPGDDEEPEISAQPTRREETA